MKTKYPEMTIDELLAEESELRTQLFNFRVQNTTKALENTAKIGETKKNLARLLTALDAKKKAAAGQK
ncbi:50S ribosomal protein L29 [Candidatus Sumerlaeota bacterium]|nr:50S ribosomal protein L29 [Candidatus Sumerlaeota bacterium]MBI3735139.1 50S ribosomal protein L29 [Candidatus Sumerlaeota bacterium]